MTATGAEKSPNSAENRASRASCPRDYRDVFFDRFNRGRYATDRSFYQIMPLAVCPTMDEHCDAAIAGDAGRIVTPAVAALAMRQTVNEGSSSTFPDT